MPGVQICHFSLTRSSRNGQLPIPVVGKPLHFEAFFCFGGRLFLHPDQAEPYTVETSDILLLSDPHGFSPASVAQTCVVYWWR